MVALAAGRPIISHRWVEACALSRTVVAVLREHLPKEKAAEQLQKFSLWLAHQHVLQQGLLLAGVCVRMWGGTAM